MSLYDPETGKINLFAVYHKEFMNRTDKLYKTMAGAEAAASRYNTKLGKEAYGAARAQDWIEMSREHKRQKYSKMK